MGYHCPSIIIWRDVKVDEKQGPVLGDGFNISLIKGVLDEVSRIILTGVGEGLERVEDKSLIEKVTGEIVPQERIWGTAGAVAGCIVGGAEVVRIHDVGEMGKFVKMCDAIWRVPKN